MMISLTASSDMSKFHRKSCWAHAKGSFVFNVLLKGDQGGPPLLPPKKILTNSVYTLRVMAHDPQ